MDGVGRLVELAKIAPVVGDEHEVLADRRGSYVLVSDTEHAAVAVAGSLPGARPGRIDEDR